MFGSLLKLAVAPVRIAAAVAAPVVATAVVVTEAVVTPVADVVDDLAKSVEDVLK